jgi:2-dehydro-3-deoxyglucarate aldolase/4-hydroxy-2-oxoheptanedioate aldolase
MKPNRIKQLLKEGKYTCGSWVSLCSPIGAEAMGLSGFDWLLIDMEHGAGDLQTLLTQLQGIAAAGETVPFVRVQWNDAVVIKRVLDLGAYGVMVPAIRSAEEAKAAVAAIKYPPQGIRGLAGNRGAKYGLDGDYVKQANDEIMMILQIENKAAIDQIDAILDVPGIDVAFLGPNDLSGDMGHVGNWDHPDVQKAIKKLEDAADKRNIPLGTVSRNWDAAKAFIDRGYRFQSLMGDLPFLIQGARAAVSSFRQHPHVAKG